MSSYKREYELTFTGTDGTFKQLTQTADKVGLMIDFNIMKSRTAKPNLATVVITNPGKDTIASFQKQGTVRLKAGYKGDIATILLGDKTSVTYMDDGGTKALSIRVLEGATSYANLQINKSYSFGSTSLDIISDLVSHIVANVPSVQSADPYVVLTPKVYIEPQVVFGPALDKLTEILSPLGYEYFINNGVLTILAVNGFLRTQQVVINSKTGMIGSPKPIMSTNNAASPGARAGVEVSSILNYNFDVGRTMLVSSNETNGIYMIDSVNFIGNSYEGDWVSNMKGYEVEAI